MKIIKDNSGEKSLPTKQVTCNNCKSELEYDSRDLTLYFWKKDFYNNDCKYLGFACPCCDDRIAIETIYAP